MFPRLSSLILLSNLLSLCIAGQVNIGNRLPIKDIFTKTNDTQSHLGPFDDKFSAYINETLESWNVPGLSIAVIDGDEVYSKVSILSILLESCSGFSLTNFNINYYNARDCHVFQRCNCSLRYTVPMPICINFMRTYERQPKDRYKSPCLDASKLFRAFYKFPPKNLCFKGY